MPPSPVADLSLPAPEPLPEICYTTPERMEFSNAKQFPHRSDEHDRRSELGAEWQLMPYGIETPGRVIFVGYRNGEDRPAKGDAGRYFVDLDRLEFCPWGQAWRPIRAEQGQAGPSHAATEYLRGDEGGIDVAGTSVSVASEPDRLLAPVQSASGNRLTHDRCQESRGGFDDSESWKHGAENAGCPSGSEKPVGLTAQHATECEPACSPSVPPCPRGESSGSIDWKYKPNQIGWKLTGSQITRIFRATTEE